MHVAYGLPNIFCRWLSWKASLGSMDANRGPLQRLCVNDDAYVQEQVVTIKREILSDIFWDRIKSTLEVVTEITRWITVFESDVPRASLVPYGLKAIQTELITKSSLSRSPLSSSDENSVKEKLQTRHKFITGENGFLFASNILDPHRRGVDLSSDEILTKFS